MNKVVQHIKTTNAFARHDYLLVVVSLVFGLAIARQMSIHWQLHPVTPGLLVAILFYFIFALGPIISLNHYTVLFSAMSVGNRLGLYLLYLIDGGRRPFLCDVPTLVVMMAFVIALVTRYTVEERRTRRSRQASD